VGRAGEEQFGQLRNVFDGDDCRFNSVVVGRYFVLVTGLALDNIEVFEEC